MKAFKKAYYADISHLDHQIGVLMNALKEKGLKKNTMVIFLSDNGYFLGNPGLGNKITMHEGSVRVPMFIHWSGLPSKGLESEELVSTIEVFSTVLEIAGIPIPDHVTGKSLVPLFESPYTLVHECVASECVGVDGKMGEGHQMVRTKKWKYILTGINEEAPYNEIADPYELNNLIKEKPKQADKMRQYMIQWMEKTGDTHKPSELKD